MLLNTNTCCENFNSFNQVSSIYCLIKKKKSHVVLIVCERLLPQVRQEIQLMSLLPGHSLCRRPQHPRSTRTRCWEGTAGPPAATPARPAGGGDHSLAPQQRATAAHSLAGPYE